jgi:hypothetical protein
MKYNESTSIYEHFCFTEKFPIILRNLEKCPECLQRFHVEWKRNFFDFESPDSAISQFPMTLMKSMASLHQGPKVSNAKPLNT